MKISLCVISVLLVVLCLVTCTQQQNPHCDIMTIEIDPADYTEKNKVSQIAVQASCIPLETTSDILVDNIIRIIRRDTFIYLADRLAIYKFKDDGKFQCKIHKSGNAPDEYITISDFQLDENGSVWILCRNNKCLYKYNWDNVLEEKKNIPYWVNSVYLLNPKEMLLYIGNETDGNNADQIKAWDLNLNKEINGFLPINLSQSKYLHVKSQNHFYAKSNDSIYFFNTFNNTVYCYNKQHLQPIYDLKFGDKNIPASFFDTPYQNVMDFFQNLHKYKYAYGTTLFAENKNSYFYSYFYDGKCHLVHKSKTDESKMDFTILEEDINLFNYPIDLTEQLMFLQNNNELIIPILPSDIVDYAEEHCTLENLAKIKQRILYSDYDQNPLILLIKLM